MFNFKIPVELDPCGLIPCWEIGDPRNRNSAVNPVKRRSVYMDRETTGLGV